MPVYKEMFTPIDPKNKKWACSSCNHTAKICKSCEVLLGGQYIDFYYCTNKDCEHHFWDDETNKCHVCSGKTNAK